ncbi:dihydropteroate synthase [Sulfurimonas sp. HSL-3221]|uniref:dihydropteroate synthase n=1 Tax=Thiomicrolovo sulfuroxydans TaxID=2894755 RepID=UPI001E3ADA26|nr:dihydropteroate synthase [Sulfurimonas sp. HSL-3221]UFS61696.1 dihydropteroate synthase [Sulfurimonas sp. HSL-3221]
MRVERLSTQSDIRALLARLDVDAGGRKILAAKAALHFIYIRDLHVGAANILKQDALSVGADLAVPKGTILAQTPRVDALLLATTRQLEELARKELAQPFGLKEVALELKRFAGVKKPAAAKIMGIVNTNEDSFFSGSRFKDAAAVERIETMIEEGAQIIDLGGVSSRPGSAAIPADEELERVKPVIDAAYAHRLYERADFSLDSYAPSVLSYALERGFNIVNDITGLADDAVAKLCGEYGATAVIMHMQGTPQTMQSQPQYDDLFGELGDFFESRIAKARAYGVEEIVLDVGIGFGKRLEHNLKLIRDLEHFRRFGYPLLVGASRKSMIAKIVPSEPSERLPGTLALHLEAVRNGAEIIRVHDVKAHAQALKIYEALYHL